MEITTFGEALRLGTALESSSAKFYEEALQVVPKTFKDIFSTLLNSKNKRQELLIRLYDDNVYSDQDTGVFEPISAMKSCDYLIHIESKENITIDDILVLSEKLESKISRFYFDLASRLKSRQSRLSKKFERIGRETLEEMAELKSLDYSSE